MTNQRDVTGTTATAPPEDMETTGLIAEVRRLQLQVALRDAEIADLKLAARDRTCGPVAHAARVAGLQEAAVVARTAGGGDGGATEWGRGHRSGCMDASAAILARLRVVESDEMGGWA